jgi:hypothetical protein
LLVFVSQKGQRQSTSDVIPEKEKQIFCYRLSKNARHASP